MYSPPPAHTPYLPMFTGKPTNMHTPVTLRTHAPNTSVLTCTPTPSCLHMSMSPHVHVPPTPQAYTRPRVLPTDTCFPSPSAYVHPRVPSPHVHSPARGSRSTRARRFLSPLPPYTPATPARCHGDEPRAHRSASAESAEPRATPPARLLPAPGPNHHPTREGEADGTNHLCSRTGWNKPSPRGGGPVGSAHCSTVCVCMAGMV